MVWLWQESHLCGGMKDLTITPLKVDSVSEKLDSCHSDKICVFFIHAEDCSVCSTQSFT